MRTIIIIIFIVILLGIGVAVLYFYYEKPAEQAAIPVYSNLNIFIHDTSKPENLIVTGYTINKMGIITNSKSSDLGAVLEKVPINSTAIISTYNLENQHYYTSYLDKFVSSQTPSRIDIYLTNPGVLNITSTGKFGETPINITIKSLGEYRNLHFCLKWSTHIITIQTGLLDITKPKEFENYDRCYNLAMSLNSTTITNLFLDYRYFDNIDERDFIDVLFYDEDCKFRECFSEINGTDVGGEDFLYKIRY